MKAKEKELKEEKAAERQVSSSPTDGGSTYDQGMLILVLAEADTSH